MSDSHSVPRGRSRRAERAQHIYSVREFSAAEEEQRIEQPNAYADYTPNEEPNADNWKGYTPNEETEADDWSAYTPNDEPVDFSAYYSRQSSEQDVPAEPAFAPPPKMSFYLDDGWTDEEAEEPAASNNVYRTRQASWVDDTARTDAIAESGMGYQVQQEAPHKQRHTLRNLLIVVLILVLLAAAGWIFREPLMKMTGLDELFVQPTEEPFTAVITPEPIKAYSAAQKTEIADKARSAILHLSGNVTMENHAVTDANIVTRNQRNDGSYDFYLFSSVDGRLLCYFEGLGPQDMMPQDGGFYVAQAPYLITPSGSARIRTDHIEAQLGEKVLLHPLCRGWSVVENEQDGSANYVNLSGELINQLWFCRVFPFTGEHTVAYVDTGVTDHRFLLYVLSADGTVSRWLSGDDMSDVIGAACSMAYLANGSLYHLPDTSKPLVHTPEVNVYLDCDAMVVQDAESGKYGLFVHGEQHYDFAYDSIRPVESDIVWVSKTLCSEDGSARMTLYAVGGLSYPNPLSHSFVLEKNGQREYVALSTQSSYPIRLDGEF